MHEINVVNTFVFICYPVTFEPVNANNDKYNDKSRVQHSCNNNRGTVSLNSKRLIRIHPALTSSSS